MHPVHADTQFRDELTVEALERRVARERLARIAAERLLEEKSQELHDTNRALQQTASLLEDQRLQLNTIFDYTIAGIFLTTENLGIRRANRTAKELFGLDDQKIMEVTIRDLFKDAAEERNLIKILTSSSETGDKLHEATGRKYDGTEFPVEFGVTHIKLPNGKRQSVWIFRDNTARKHAEAKRVALEHELSQAHKMEALGTLASGVAHEINTPVQYVSDNIRFLQDSFNDLTDLILSYQDALYNAPQPHDKTSFLKSKEQQVDLEFLIEESPKAIEQSLQGMIQVASIVKAIKEFSHPGEEEKVEIDINKAIETTLTVSRNQWKYVAEAELDFAENLPLVPCLPSDINQVFLNMIVNAADAIEAAHRKNNGLIKISTRLNNKAVEIRVSDNGCGIPEDLKARIFDPFFTTKDVGKGTGQGLSISYSIIRRKHGGTIDFTSTPGEGTCFIINLPIDATSIKENDDVEAL